MDSGVTSEEPVEFTAMEPIVETETLAVADDIEQISPGSRSTCASPASSQGGVYSVINFFKILFLLHCSDFYFLIFFYRANCLRHSD